jgi:hypothetical protein
MGAKRNAYEVMVGIPEGKRSLEEEDGSERNTVGGCVLDSFGSELGPLAGSCGHGSKLSRSIKCGEF